MNREGGSDDANTNEIDRYKRKELEMASLKPMWIPILTSAVLMAVLMSGEVRAQADPETMELKVYELEHAVASEMLNTINALNRDWVFRATADGRSNRIVVQASSTMIEKLTDMIATLDTPVRQSGGRQAKRSPDVETIILRPRHREVSAFIEPIKMHLSGTGRTAVDRARNVIVVRDHPTILRSLEGLVKDLDVAANSLSLKFLVLGPGGDDLEGVADARKAMAELEALGLRGYGVVGRAAVRCVELSDFKTEGIFDTGQMEIGGFVRLVSGDNQAEINVTAEMRLQTQNKQGATPGVVSYATAALRSTLKVPVGHLAIVGLTPAGGEANQPLVMAVRADSE